MDSIFPAVCIYQGRLIEENGKASNTYGIQKIRSISIEIDGVPSPGFARPHRFANEDCKARGNFCRTRTWFQATGE